MKNKSLVSLFFLFLLYGSATAQNNGISAFLGPAFYPAEKANGYQLALAYQRKIHQNGTISLETSQLYHSSRGILPKDISNMSIIFRDYTHFEPFGPDNNPFLWKEESFPALRLQARPNRFFHLNIGLKYLYHFESKRKGKWAGGLGVFLSYSDEMKLIKLLRTEKLTLTVPPTDIQEAYIPIFYFGTYLDYALSPEVTYHYQLRRQFSIGFSGRFYFFPTSNKTMLALTASCKKVF